jgi:hypothetical protein
MDSAKDPLASSGTCRDPLIWGINSTFDQPQFFKNVSARLIFIAGDAWKSALHDCYNSTDESHKGPLHQVLQAASPNVDPQLATVTESRAHISPLYHFIRRSGKRLGAHCPRTKEGWTKEGYFRHVTATFKRRSRWNGRVQRLEYVATWSTICTNFNRRRRHRCPRYQGLRRQKNCDRVGSI